MSVRMITWFNHTAKKDLKLMSVHIPKTAGTSFRLILEEIYGKNNVVRLDQPLIKEEVWVDQKRWNKKELPKCEVIHGHFNLERLQNTFEVPSVTKITWLRHPVDRVISNYFYLSKRLEEELDEKRKNLNILSKMKRSLEEYASDELNQNRMTKFLAGTELDGFDFVGIVEYFQDDLNVLADQLGWRDLSLKRVNETGDSKSQKVSDAVRALITELNSEDVKLYNRALELRSERR